MARMCTRGLCRSILKFYLGLQGSLSLSLNRSEAAVMAFRKAQSLRADLRAYQGDLLGIALAIIALNKLLRHVFVPS